MLNNLTRVRVSHIGEMEEQKRKGDKLKGMDYWKKWCSQTVSSGEAQLATEPTTSLLAAGNETVKISEPSTVVTVSNDEIDSVAPAPCFMATTTEPTFSLEPTGLPVTSSFHPVAELDVGFYSNQDEIVDEYLKAQILKMPWTPSKDYKFPMSTKRNLRFQLEWTERFPLLSYPEYKSGAFCRICVKNALYTSPQIQNEIIDISGEIIQHKIIEEVKRAKLFAILADETTDIARVEQVSLCLRYVDSNDDKHHKVKEMFIEYIPTVDVTGSGLANLIITALKKHGLKCSHVVGQGYDGAAAMTNSGIEEAICMYSSVLPERSTSVVKAELDVWKAVMTSTFPTPKSALECLDKCDRKLYLNINTLLQILATIPVSTATPERTFSSLRRLKNYLRNTTSENRLNGLALMNIHYGTEIDADEVLDASIPFRIIQDSQRPETTQVIGQPEQEQFKQLNEGISWSTRNLKYSCIPEAGEQQRTRFKIQQLYKKKDWEVISQELNKFGYKKSGVKCDEKWRNLRKTYDKVRTEIDKTGNSKVSWKFYEAFQEIYWKDPHFVPIATASSTGESIKRKLTDTSNFTTEKGDDSSNKKNLSPGEKKRLKPSFSAAEIEMRRQR
ncbi:unnamed protein product [Phaedon cochleariae]|uniref:Uncharacterized protein n=1 Tax=Phaedon cochleariae TaxID=80249 RepID=A0A9N9SJG3_PHACE|nr:unnamed protein product [Phaedon cochleariae]